MLISPPYILGAMKHPENPDSIAGGMIEDNKRISAEGKAARRFIKFLSFPADKGIFRKRTEGFIELHHHIIRGLRISLPEVFPGVINIRIGRR